MDKHDVGKTCGDNNDCKSYLCTNGVCEANGCECDASWCCVAEPWVNGYTQYCAGGECVDKKDFGESCGSYNECQSNSCCWGTCQAGNTQC